MMEHRFFRVVGAFLGLLGLVVFLQVLRGSFSSGFGTSPDEPAHYVTGLMVRDYLVYGFGTHPMRFAEQFYIHYPRVALGQWPPMLYVLQALWMLPFGVSRVAVILLMVILATMIGVVIFLTAVRLNPRWVGVAVVSATLFLTFPLIQELSGAVMTEIPLALFCLLAVVTFGRFLDSGRPVHCVLFGLFAIMAIMTKGDGLALALVPPIGILITRRWELLKSPLLWFTGLAIGLICAPWYVLTLDRVSTTWVGTSGTSLEYAAYAVPFYVVALFGMGGALVACVTAIGLWRGLILARPSGVLASALGLVAGALMIHGLIPSSTEERHMVMVAPAVMLFFAQGLGWIQGTLDGRADWIRLAAIPVVTIGLVAVNIMDAPAKNWHGFPEASQWAVSNHGLDERAILVSSDSTGDGILIADTAMFDRRPGRVMLRADRVLSHSDWVGRNYVLFYKEPSELLEVLDAVPVAAVIVDHSLAEGDRRPHHGLLYEAVSNPNTPWRLAERFDVVREGVRYPGALEIFMRLGDSPIPNISFDQVFGNPPKLFVPQEKK